MILIETFEGQAVSRPLVFLQGSGAIACQPANAPIGVTVNSGNVIQVPATLAPGSYQFSVGCTGCDGSADSIDVELDVLPTTGLQGGIDPEPVARQGFQVFDAMLAAAADPGPQPFLPNLTPAITVNGGQWYPSPIPSQSNILPTAADYDNAAAWMLQQYALGHELQTIDVESRAGWPWVTIAESLEQMKTDTIIAYETRRRIGDDKLMGYYGKPGPLTFSYLPGDLWNDRASIEAYMDQLNTDFTFVDTDGNTVTTSMLDQIDHVTPVYYVRFNDDTGDYAARYAAMINGMTADIQRVTQDHFNRVQGTDREIARPRPIYAIWWNRYANSIAQPKLFDRMQAATITDSLTVIKNSGVDGIIAWDNFHSDAGPVGPQPWSDLINHEWYPAFKAWVEDPANNVQTG